MEAGNEKIVVTHSDLAAISTRSDSPSKSPSGKERKLPIWVRILMVFAVPVTPILCIITLPLLFITRRYSDKSRSDALTFICWLLLVSAAIASTIAVFGWKKHNPLDALVFLQEFKSQPRLELKLPATVLEKEITPAELARDFENTVVIVTSPSEVLFEGKALSQLSGFGSGVLLNSSESGSLLVTNTHVLKYLDTDEEMMSRFVTIIFKNGQRRLAQVAGVHKKLDLTLLWMKAPAAAQPFKQRVLSSANLALGTQVVTFGHPQGLYFTLGSGMISRTEPGIIQISAPTSPGSSGGPVYNLKGQLIAVVTSMMDKRIDPNSENLNFAMPADGLQEPDAWTFSDAFKDEARKSLGSLDFEKSATEPTPKSKPQTE